MFRVKLNNWLELVSCIIKFVFPLRGILQIYLKLFIQGCGLIRYD